MAKCIWCNTYVCFCWNIFWGYVVELNTYLSYSKKRIGHPVCCTTKLCDMQNYRCLRQNKIVDDLLQAGIFYSIVVDLLIFCKSGTAAHRELWGTAERTRAGPHPASAAAPNPVCVAKQSRRVRPPTFGRPRFRYIKGVLRKKDKKVSTKEVSESLPVRRTIALFLYRCP